MFHILIAPLKGPQVDTIVRGKGGGWINKMSIYYSLCAVQFIAIIGIESGLDSLIHFFLTDCNIYLVFTVSYQQWLSLIFSTFSYYASFTDFQVHRRFLSRTESHEEQSG